MIDLVARVVGAPVAVEELKHKPGRRRTVRVRGEAASAIVKLYASDRAPIVAARVAALAAGPPEPAVPHVLLVDPSRHVVVLSDVAGTPLRAALLEGDVDACGRAGRALGTWHRFWRGRAPRPLRHHPAARELEILRARADAAPPEIASAVERELASLEGEWPCSTVVHRDLYEEQILVGERVGLIDLDDAAIGPPELDLGNLVAHLELLELRSGRTLTPTVEALLDAHAGTAPRLDDALLARCRRLALLRLACIHAEARLVER